MSPLSAFRRRIPAPDGMSWPHVVIIGGGFAGANAALELRDARVRVTLIDRNIYKTFQPLLYQVATGALEADSIAYPLRKIFAGQKNFFFRLADVRGVRPADKAIETNLGDIHYDYLVLATGSYSRTLPGLEIDGERVLTSEQALRLDAEINERTDVFLLGAMLYEILAGHPPHRGPNLVAILYRAITCNIAPPQDVAPERQPPLALSAIAMKALSRDPQDRHASAQELKAEVERFLRDQ